MRQEHYEATAVIRDGRMELDDRAGFERAICRFADGTAVVSVKVLREKRSNAQNRFWHGVVIPVFAEALGYELNEMKDALALELLPKTIVDMTTGEERTVPGHTSDLNTKEFKDLIERAQRFGAEMPSPIYVPDPGEYI